MVDTRDGKATSARVVAIVGLLAIAWFATGSVPDHSPFYGGDCGSVSDWASNQDLGCNDPLLDRACVVIAVLAIAALLVLDLLVRAKASRSVRAINVAAWALAPVLALIAINQTTSGTTWPNAVAALGTLALAVAAVAAVPVGAAVPWPARGVVLAIAAAASAVLAGYAHMLWGGNGA